MEFEKHIQDTCEHLEEIVSLMGGHLSKDLDSISTLEEVLASVVNENDEEATSGARYLIAVYLGEIVINAAGGEWIKSTISNNIALSIDNQQSFPLEAVEEFIKNPKNGQLEFFAKGLISANRI
ncbi:hypothetical protein BST55_22155 [Vibrio vulnificus]|uniref:hypothetical protein n=1 Tax=Vibrio vulnificus TaxID=672 RepID=UPI000BA07876|nr:hypothetical protein [Vibrio vulnificus]EGR8992190.1 hypothetical protein [Vibrio vulnificus]EKK9988574.1 hypothetical protein [Vibrio vulnificus]MCU8566723.1 hypothetical protein [Vibrio vulnificus]OZS53447.1 hypothetical protein BST51_10915 [Vibrio vulnificus]OZS58852.1 hypothetical protein BST52_03295 [Vibrio vulnificus]